MPVNASAEGSIRISVVVPTHHRPELLKRLLASLAAQSYPHDAFEVIVVGSAADAGAAVVAEAAGATDVTLRFSTLADDPSQGRNPSAKRNHGAQLARGEWLAFTDDDCVATPDWLAAAAPRFGDQRIGGLEGRKVIPPVDPPTPTYRGLLLMTTPGGYQTCNMFYRRADFLRLGGFDLRFPFYLEDTDLAWTFLDAGLALPFAADAVVEHPVLPPQPWRLWADAKRPILLPYLCKKHPQLYRASRVRPLRRSSFPYLALDAALLVALLAGQLGLVGVSLALLLLLTLAHATKLFVGHRVQPGEVLVTTLLLPVVPPVALVQFLRGCWRYRTWAPAV